MHIYYLTNIYMVNAFLDYHAKYNEWGEEPKEGPRDMQALTDASQDLSSPTDTEKVRGVVLWYRDHVLSHETYGGILTSDSEAVKALVRENVVYVLDNTHPVNRNLWEAELSAL